MAATTSPSPTPAVDSSVYCIPTNRPADRSVRSYLTELEFARQRYGRIIPLLLSETNDGPHVAGNTEALARAAGEHPDIPLYHLTVARQREYFDLLLRDEPEPVRALFYSQDRNYATAMNKLYLMTVSMGAQALHRRDSDTRLLAEEVPEAAGKYPIEVELDCLGRRVADVDAEPPRPIDQATGERPVCVVGSNYFGEWNLDVKDFARRSYEIIHRLYVILGFDPDNVVELCAEIFPTEQVYDGADTRHLVLIPNEGANPDCGNVAITRIHESLPNTPSRNNPAADYFGFDASLAMGVPSVYHTRFVFHEYHSDRFDPAQKKLYWEGVSRFADYFNVYGPLFEDGAVGHAGSGAPLLSDQLMAALDRAVGALPGTDHDARVARIKALAEEVLIPFDDRYAEIGRHILANADRYVREADEDYATHRLLLERWPTMIERARGIDLRDVVTRAAP